MNTHDSSAHDRRVNEAIAAYLEAAEAGRAPTPDEFLALYPDLAPELKAFLADREQFKEFVRPLDPSLPDASEPEGRDAPTLAPGERAPAENILGRVRYFGDYELLEEIARGGMGVVYKARQTSLHRTVALKMILAGQLASAEDVKRFYAEAEAAAKLDHPGIVPIFEVGQHEGQHYFSMAFVEGQSLAHRVSQGVLPPREAAALIRQVAGAIAYAHVEGVIHRDLKPANILIDPDGQPRVTDFGLAKQVPTGQPQSGAQSPGPHTATGQVLGTPSYMPPEQAAGKSGAIGPLADVYSLGAVLYCLLTGRPPFQAATALDTVLQVLQQEPVSPRQLNASVPLDLETICLKCLEKEPRKRYASAQELVDELLRFLKGEPIKARPVGHAERLWRWCRRNPRVASLSAAVVLLLVLTTVISTASAARIATEHRTTVQALSQAEQEIYFNNVTLAHLYWQGNNVATAQALLDQAAPERRNWEWNYLKRLVHTELLSVPAGSGRIGAVAFIPDGTRLVSTDSISKTEHPYIEAHTWDTATGKPLLTLAGSEMTADGKRVATQGADQSIQVWDTATGKVLVTLQGQKFPLTGIAQSADGKYLGTVGVRTRVLEAGEPTPLDLLRQLSEIKGEARIWEAATGRLLASFEDRNEPYAIAFSPDGKRFAVPGKVCDTATGKPLLTLAGGDYLVVWSPDGKRIAGSAGNRVQLWDAATGKTAGFLRGHSDWVRGIAFRPDGKRIATASEDRTARLWDAVSGEEIVVIRGHTSGLSGVAFNQDGTRLATSGGLDRTVKVWDLTRGQEAVSFLANAGDIHGVAYRPDGLLLASAEAAAGIRLRDVRTGRVLAQLAHFSPFAVAFSPDGHHLASAGLGKQVKIWDVHGIEPSLKEPIRDSNKRLVHPLMGHGNYVNSVAFSPDGLTVASASQDGTVKLWSLADGKEKWTATHHDAFAYVVTFRPDGKHLAVVWGADLILLDATSGEKTLGQFETKAGGITTAAYSRDGKYLAFNERNVIHVWDAATGRNLHTLTGPSGWISRLVFSGDGTRLVTAREDGTITFWDWQTGAGREALTLRGHTGRGGAQTLDFSPDGTHLATGGSDSTIKIWDGTPLEN